MGHQPDWHLGKSGPSRLLSLLLSYALISLAAVLAPVATGVSDPSSTRSPGLSEDALTLEARAQYQRRLEEVYK